MDKNKNKIRSEWNGTISTKYSQNGQEQEQNKVRTDKNQNTARMNKTNKNQNTVKTNMNNKHQIQPEWTRTLSTKYSQNGQEQEQNKIRMDKNQIQSECTRPIRTKIQSE